MSAPWSREKDKQLLRLQAMGLSASQIAERLRTTRGAVIGRSARLRGVVFASQTRRHKTRSTRQRSNPRTDAALAAMGRAIARGVRRDQAIISAVRAGASYQAIAEDLGLSRQRVQQIVAPVLGYRTP
jgi:hypothetical protein